MRNSRKRSNNSNSISDNVSGAQLRDNGKTTTAPKLVALSFSGNQDFFFGQIGGAMVTGRRLFVAALTPCGSRIIRDEQVAFFGLDFPVVVAKNESFSFQDQRRELSVKVVRVKVV